MSERKDADRTGRTGAGSEAAEGIHNAQQRDRDETDRTGTEGAGTGRSAGAGGIDRAGSEPMKGRTREHQSGYGGAGGTPKTSSDQREPLEPTGSEPLQPLGDEEAGDGIGR